MPYFSGSRGSVLLSDAEVTTLFHALASERLLSAQAAHKADGANQPEQAESYRAIGRDAAALAHRLQTVIG